MSEVPAGDHSTVLVFAKLLRILTTDAVVGCDDRFQLLLMGCEWRGSRVV